MMSKGESGEVVGLKYILWVDGTSLSSKCTYDLSFMTPACYCLYHTCINRLELSTLSVNNSIPNLQL